MPRYYVHVYGWYYSPIHIRPRTIYPETYALRKRQAHFSSPPCTPPAPDQRVFVLLRLTFSTSSPNTNPTCASLHRTHRKPPTITTTVPISNQAVWFWSKTGTA